MALAQMSNDVTQVIMSPDSQLNFIAYPKHVYHHVAESFDYQPLADFKSLWRNVPQGEVFLGIVSNRYRVIQNHEIFHAVEEALRSIFHTLVSVSIHEEWVDDGAVCFRQYIVHSSMRQLDEYDRSRIAFRVIVNNSFNGSKSATVLAGAIDSFCTNGMIIGEYDRLSNSHHTELNVIRLTKFIKNAYEAFGRDFEMNRKLLGTSCTRKHALALLKKLNDTDKFNDNIGKELDDNIVHHGRNLWAVLSTATWWSSTRDASWAVPNGEAASNNAPLRRLERQKEVRSWCKSHLVPHAGTDIFAKDPIEEVMA